MERPQLEGCSGMVGPCGGERAVDVGTSPRNLKMRPEDEVF